MDQLNNEIHVYWYSTKFFNIDETTVFVLSADCWYACKYIEASAGAREVINWCRDKDGLNCWRYVDTKCLGFYEDWARENCPYRCGYCPMHMYRVLELTPLIVDKPPCEDTDSSCDAYHQESCTNSTTRAYMREHCRKRCNECHCE
uniref:Uncharacterized protein n=1 Tax=Magallana gigas TaxID=29159 RepID=K1RFJ1_MAGGI